MSVLPVTNDEIQEPKNSPGKGNITISLIFLVRAEIPFFCSFSQEIKNQEKRKKKGKTNRKAGKIFYWYHGNMDNIYNNSNNFINKDINQRNS